MLLWGGHVGRPSTPACGENRRPVKIVVASLTRVFTAPSFMHGAGFLQSEAPLGSNLFY